MIEKVGLYRDGRNKSRPWTCRWYGEYDSKTGKEKRYSKSFKLKAKAESFIAEQTTNFEKGKQRDRADEITLKDFCADWLKTKRPQLSHGTIILYENTIRRLLSYFGPNIPILKVTPIKAAKFVGEIKPLKKKKQELSNATRHRILRNCRTMFGEAVTWELISKNPFKTVKAPKCTVKRWHYLKADEYGRLLKAAPSLRWKALYALGYRGC